MNLGNCYGLFMFYAITAHNISYTETIQILIIRNNARKVYDIFGINDRLSVELNSVDIILD